MALTNPLMSLFLVLSLVLPTLAFNNILLHNNCPYPLYFWPVTHSSTPDNIPLTPIPPGLTHPHAMLTVPEGGISLKIRDQPFITPAPAGILQFEYHLEAPRFFYDFSRIDCDANVGRQDPGYCPIVGEGVKVVAGEGRCEGAECVGAECEGAYLRRGSWPGEPSFSCGWGEDVWVGFCVRGEGGGGGGRGGGGGEQEVVVEVVEEVEVGGSC
ncbi:hypothetical protein EJ04DRAFT_601711 [Polyplosphaeria fusca]|uniref:Uncharacterized protein n=1 Tax=Polyplosphaeria fusca TaxID=682080 RepID=A0A9P4QWK2_9PLEO|nr:hypothetical protein EJ04DRAFT_601711 [Polyplosphaeria fusca]